MVGGLVTQGYITENMLLAVGPFDDGKFRDVNVSSIRRNKAPCRYLNPRKPVIVYSPECKPTV